MGWQLHFCSPVSTGRGHQIDLETSITTGHCAFDLKSFGHYLNVRHIRRDLPDSIYYNAMLGPNGKSMETLPSPCKSHFQIDVRRSQHDWLWLRRIFNTILSELIDSHDALLWFIYELPNEVLSMPPHLNNIGWVPCAIDRRYSSEKSDLERCFFSSTKALTFRTQQGGDDDIINLMTSYAPHCLMVHWSTKVTPIPTFIDSPHTRWTIQRLTTCH